MRGSHLYDLDCRGWVVSASYSCASVRFSQSQGDWEDPPGLGRVIGCRQCAIQLARDSGYEVFTTAGVRNHEHCTILGAAKVFDYRNEAVHDGIVDALRERALWGGRRSVEGTHGSDVKR